MATIKLPPFSNVGSGQLATLSTSALFGRSVHAVALVLGGTTFTKANISNLRVTLNSKPLVPDITGSNLQKLNSYVGLADKANVLMLYFGNPTARTIRGEHIGDVDQSIYQSPLEIQIEIDASAVAPTIEAFAVVGVPKMSMGVGYTADEAAILKARFRTIINPANAVTKAAYDVAVGSAAGARIEHIGLFGEKVTNFEVKKAGVIIFENLGSTLNESLQDDQQRVPQVGLYVWDPMVDHNVSEAVTTVRPDGKPYNIQFLLTTSGSETITAYTAGFTKLGLI